MITRYTPSSYGSMSEKENGEYVKYSDYEELLKEYHSLLDRMEMLHLLTKERVIELRNEIGE